MLTTVLSVVRLKRAPYPASLYLSMYVRARLRNYCLYQIIKYRQIFVNWQMTWLAHRRRRVSSLSRAISCILLFWSVSLAVNTNVCQALFSIAMLPDWKLLISSCYVDVRFHWNGVHMMYRTSRFDFAGPAEMLMINVTDENFMRTSVWKKGKVNLTVRVDLLSFKLWLYSADCGGAVSVFESNCCQQAYPRSICHQNLVPTDKASESWLKLSHICMSDGRRGYTE